MLNMSVKVKVRSVKPTVMNVDVEIRDEVIQFKTIS